MVLRLLTSLFLFLCLLAPAGQGWAADITDTVDQSVAAEAPFPGLSELAARSLALADFATRSEETLKQLSDLTRIQNSFQDLENRFAKIEEEIAPLGSPDDWYVDRLFSFIQRVELVSQGLRNIQDELTGRQQDIEHIRTQLDADREFWAAWGRDLKKRQLTIPKDTLAQVQSLLKGLDQALKGKTNGLLQLQERVGTLQRRVLDVDERLIQSLTKLRKATFRRNAYSFFSPEFYQRFTGELFEQGRSALSAGLKVDPYYLANSAWLLLFMLLALLTITIFIKIYRGRLQGADQWQFILSRPVAAATFVVVAVFWFWLPPPPPLIRFVFLLCAVVAATSLARPLLKNQDQVKLLVLAAGVVLVTNAFRLMSLPQPLFRLYLALLAIIFVPLLGYRCRVSRNSQKAAEERYYRLLLRLLMVILTISLIGQIAGFMNLSSWLIQAGLETGMTLLFSRMTVLLLSGGVELGITVLSSAGYGFFVRFGQDLGRRLKRLFNVAIYVFALFYLIPVWRFCATMEGCWGYVSELGVTIGNIQLTVQMLLFALMAFYLSFQLSWVIQGLSESRIFSRRPVDQGVRDAVKKLIHYAVVLVGFLFSLSLLGLGLQNFVVLLGAFGVGIGFGLQDIVNNFLSGLILLFERPIKVGDGVMIDGEYGTVMQIGLRSTVVKNLDEAELIVPNSNMIAQKVTNWTLSNRRVRIVVPVGVAYGSNLEKVLAILGETAVMHPKVLGDPAPMSLFVSFGSSSLDFELRVWIDNVDDRPRVKNELMLYIDRRFREERIEIPFPQQDLHLRSVDAGILAAGPRPENSGEST